MKANNFNGETACNGKDSNKPEVFTIKQSRLYVTQRLRDVADVCHFFAISHVVNLVSPHTLQCDGELPLNDLEGYHCIYTPNLVNQKPGDIVSELQSALKHMLDNKKYRFVNPNDGSVQVRNSAFLIVDTTRNLALARPLAHAWLAKQLGLQNSSLVQRNMDSALNKKGLRQNRKFRNIGRTLMSDGTGVDRRVPKMLLYSRQVLKKLQSEGNSRGWQTKRYQTISTQPN